MNHSLPNIALIVSVMALIFATTDACRKSQRNTHIFQQTRKE